MKYLILLGALALAGCQCQPQIVERVRTVEVRVPVPTPIPEPKETVRPELMIYQLVEADADKPGKVVQYYKASVKQLQGYVVELETIIDGYRKASQDQKEAPK